MITVVKLDESYSLLQGQQFELMQIYDFLKIRRQNAQHDPLVQRGLKSPFDYFATWNTDRTVLLVYNGTLSLLKKFNVPSIKYTSKYTDNDLEQYLKSLSLPFKPYDYQIKAFKESILDVRKLNVMCTGSGKSLTISLICDFYRVHGLKGLLIVPNINLLTQFKSDIKSYNLNALYDRTETLGDGVQEIADCDLLITTWQSMVKHLNELSRFSYIVCDEVHRISGDVSSSIIKEAKDIQIRYGFTGTLPEDMCAKMTIIGLFTYPTFHITARQLIDRGLATNAQINTIFLDYSRDFKVLLRNSGNYQTMLQMIKEHQNRLKFITDLSCKLKGNTLVLGQHINHMKDMYLSIMRKLYPDVAEIENKDITGKHSFEFQKQYGVYFLSGSDDSKTRECTRKILEHKLFKTDKGLRFDDEITNEIIINEVPQILVSNYAILSTGVNIKRLHNMIFASPMKSYNSITQSIGRGLRLSKDKTRFNVFDIVDCTGLRKVKSGVFYRSYEHRLETSYNREKYLIREFMYSI